MRIGERLPTPVDNRGFVETGELAQLVLENSTPQQLESHDSCHHEYWDVRRMRGNQPGHLIRTYRELPINKVVLPRGVHDVLHDMTLPPPLPRTYVMNKRIAAWNVANDMLDAYDSVIGRSKNTPVDEELLQISDEEVYLSIGKQYSRYHELKRRRKEIPREFRLDHDFDNKVFSSLYRIRSEMKPSRLERGTKSHMLTGKMKLEWLGVEVEQAA